MANLIDDNDKWAGGETVVVQVQTEYGVTRSYEVYKYKVYFYELLMVVAK